MRSSIWSITLWPRMAKWGFPVSGLDLRLLAKSYLDQKGVKPSVSKFKWNFPGDDWVCRFLKHHREHLSQRTASNISRSRASVDPPAVTLYFDNLKETLQDVPAENIFNFNESNLTDDPGKRRVLCKWGTKYVTRVCNSTKSSTSIMFCGSASGVLTPPYVVYKAESLWDSWCIGGLKGAPALCPKHCCHRGTRYNRSKSGWFYLNCFSDWFKMCFLPHAKKLTGPKVLIGDNLSSHFSSDVLKLCSEYNICFVCLPSNSTHFLQPLDVSFFVICSALLMISSFAQLCWWILSICSALLANFVLDFSIIF